LVMMVGLPPSIAATAELVVPRSMPTTCAAQAAAPLSGACPGGGAAGAGAGPGAAARAHQWRSVAVRRRAGALSAPGAHLLAADVHGGGPAGGGARAPVGPGRGHGRAARGLPAAARVPRGGLHPFAGVAVVCGAAGSIARQSRVLVMQRHRRRRLCMHSWRDCGAAGALQCRVGPRGAGFWKLTGCLPACPPQAVRSSQKRLEESAARCWGAVSRPSRGARPAPPADRRCAATRERLAQNRSQPRRQAAPPAPPTSPLAALPAPRQLAPPPAPPQLPPAAAAAAGQEARAVQAAHVRRAGSSSPTSRPAVWWRSAMPEHQASRSWRARASLIELTARRALGLTGAAL
jgi:hypothetical protein